jgi:hypothetical protein
MSIVNGKRVITWLAILPMFAVFFFCMSPDTAKAEGRRSFLTSVGDEYFENSKNGDMWTKVRSKRIKEFSDVQQYLSDLNEGQFNDWRLPTRQELYDLFLIFDLKNNGDVRIRVEGKYWLASDEGKLSVGAWEIGGGCGPERGFFSGGKGHIRAIRP